MPGKEPGVEKGPVATFQLSSGALRGGRLATRRNFWDFTIPFPRDRLKTAARMNNCIFPHCP
jgi:hypothetical protein